MGNVGDKALGSVTPQRILVHMGILLHSYTSIYPINPTWSDGKEE